MKSEVLFFRATPETKEKLKEIADQKEWSISKVVEKLVLNSLQCKI